MYIIGILVFPGVEELDFAGPFEILSYINKIRPGSVDVMIVAENSDPVDCFNGLTILPHADINDCVPLDVLIVPGGRGRIEAMGKRNLLEFITKQNNYTTYTASVCTGAFLLAGAGLLKGRRATTYHTAFDELSSYSIEAVRSKVVKDGKFITSAGVSSGIELGLFLLRLLFGTEDAAEVARRVEYEIDVNSL